MAEKPEVVGAWPCRGSANIWCMCFSVIALPCLALTYGGHGAGSPNALATTSRRPSAAKSATAAPRWVPTVPISASSSKSKTASPPAIVSIIRFRSVGAWRNVKPTPESSVAGRKRIWAGTFAAWHSKAADTSKKAPLDGDIAKFKLSRLAVQTEAFTCKVGEPGHTTETVPWKRQSELSKFFPMIYALI